MRRRFQGVHGMRVTLSVVRWSEQTHSHSSIAQQPTHNQGYRVSNWGTPAQRLSSGARRDGRITVSDAVAPSGGSDSPHVSCFFTAVPKAIPPPSSGTAN